jgi:hypothetical protein
MGILSITKIYVPGRVYIQSVSLNREDDRSGDNYIPGEPFPGKQEMSSGKSEQVQKTKALEKDRSGTRYMVSVFLFIFC